MELLGADADLRSETELESIRKAGRCIHIDAGAVNPLEELLCRCRVRGENTVRVPRVDAVDMVDCLLNAPDGFDRHLEIKVLGLIVLFRCRNGVRKEGKTLLVRMQLHAVLLHGPGKKRQKILLDVPVHDEGLRGVAHAGALGLGIQDHRDRLLQIRCPVDIDAAVAGSGLDDRHPAVFRHCLDQSLRAPGDQDVNKPLHLHELLRVLPVYGINEKHRIFRCALFPKSSLQALCNCLVGENRIASALQNHDVAAL